MLQFFLLFKYKIEASFPRRTESKKQTTTMTEALISACGKGDLDTVRRLLGPLSQQAEAVTLEATGLVARREALLAQLCDVDAQIAQARPDVDASNEDDMTALHCACDNGHRDVVELLLDYGIDVNQLGCGWDSGMDIPPSTGLIYACRSGHQDVVQLLLDRDADDSWTGDGEKTALLTACGSGHRGVVELLLKHGVDINQRGGGEWGAVMTGLHCACDNGHRDVVELLLDRGVDVNQVEGSCEQASAYTGLHYACRGGHRDVVELLLDRGADVNQASACGTTALMATFRAGRPDLSQLLLDHGADINKSTPHVTPYGSKQCVDLGWSHLVLAAEYGQDACLRMLLDCVAVVSKRLLNTALYSACEGGHCGVVKLLLDRGADAKAEDPSPPRPVHTALEIACQEGHRGVVELLLDHGADAASVALCTTCPVRKFGAAPGAEYNTVSVAPTMLAVACRFGHRDVAELLLDRGADLAHVDKNGRSPLVTACVEGRWDVAELLLDRGADLQQTDKRRTAPAMYAVCDAPACCDERNPRPRRHTEVAQLLLDRGANGSPTRGKGCRRVREVSRELCKLRAAGRARSKERCERIAEELMKVVWHPEGRMFKYEELDESD